MKAQQFENYPTLDPGIMETREHGVRDLHGVFWGFPGGEGRGL